MSAEKSDLVRLESVAAMRKTMAERHEDRTRSNDCGSHTDSGIGVEL